MAKSTINRKKRTKVLADEAELANVRGKQKFTSEYRNKAFESSERSVNDLLNYFSATTQGTKKILPKEKRRYAIYLRKSTDDEAKQVRSLDDQRSECLKLTSRLGVVVRDEDIFVESASAKTSGNRPIFDKMLMGFRASKYHGLVAWSPDRLSRNMKEAGEVIEMIDHEEIQDLAFVTYQFDNSPNGKMMLGILFATSKQYSDKLAVDVKRGTVGNIVEGRYNGVTKKGYFVDSVTGYFTPDEYNWNLLRKAVDMRLYEGKNNTDIADFLNDAKLTGRKDQDDKFSLIKVTKQMVGNIFADSFYCGLYSYGDNLANLVDLYNFKPLITADEYIQLNADVAKDFGKTVTVKTNRSQRLDYGLLHNKVICDYCDETMRFQHTVIKRGKNTGKWVISFYCRNKACLRHNTAEQKKLNIKLSKSIRAKYVLAGIEWQLRHLTKRSEQAFRMHINSLEQQIASDRATLQRKLAEAKQSQKNNEQQYARYQEFQVNSPDDYKKYHEGKLEEYQRLIRLDEEAIENNKTELAKLDVALPTEQEFYELTRSKVLGMLKTTDIMVIDTICSEFVANLRAGNDSTSVIKLKPPYNLMTELDEISTGRGERAQTFDLSVPNRARYQLRHTPKLVQLCVPPFIVAQMRQKVQFYAYHPVPWVINLAMPDLA